MKQINGIVLHALGGLSLLAAVVLSFIGAVEIFTASSGFWTGQGHEVLVSSYLVGSLMLGVFGVLLIAGGLLMARPWQFARPVAALGAVYCLVWLAETIFLSATGHSWLTSSADIVTLVVCFLPGLVALLESRGFHKPRRA